MQNVLRRVKQWALLSLIPIEIQKKLRKLKTICYHRASENLSSPQINPENHQFNLSEKVYNHKFLHPFKEGTTYAFNLLITSLYGLCLFLFNNIILR